MEPNRITPILPSSALKTYQIVAPKQTHTRAATCAEVQCPAYLNGWVTRVPAGSPQEQFIRSGANTRTFNETTGVKDLGAGVVEFMFNPGQRCFRAEEHRISLEREPLYLVRDGDFRGFTGRRQHARAADWVDDFATHQDGVARLRERG